jgi:hypothetical protein
LHERLRRRSNGVTILLTHYSGDSDSVELCDGMLGSDDFASRVPADHSGIIDLCMCHPMKLVSSIKRAAPNSSVRFANAALTPASWFLFYAHLFRLLKTKERNYIDAVEQTCMTLSTRGVNA